MSKKKNIEKEIQEMSAFENDDNTMSGSLMDDFANADSGMSSDDVVDMSFDDVYEETTHPSGTEVKLRCVGADKGIDKNGAAYWKLRYEDANDPHVRQIGYFIGFPNKEIHSVRQINNKKKGFMDWKLAHNLPLETPVSLNDCVGLEAWAILKQTESEEYGIQNEVKSWILPKD